LSRDFQPSPESLSPAERTLGALRYLKKAVEVVEKHVEEHGEPPHWVVERIHIATRAMGMAVSYLSYSDNKKPKKAAKKRKERK
jgi:hypothetical protein